MRKNRCTRPSHLFGKNFLLRKLVIASNFHVLLPQKEWIKARVFFSKMPARHFVFRRICVFLLTKMAHPQSVIFRKLKSSRHTFLRFQSYALQLTRLINLRTTTNETYKSTMRNGIKEKLHLSFLCQNILKTALNGVSLNFSVQSFRASTYCLKLNVSFLV